MDSILKLLGPYNQNKQVANTRFREQSSLLSHQVRRLLFLASVLKLGPETHRAQANVRKDPITSQVYTADLALGCLQRDLEPYQGTSDLVGRRHQYLRSFIGSELIPEDTVYHCDPKINGDFIGLR